MYFHYLVPAILLVVLSASNAQEMDIESLCSAEDDVKEAIAGCMGHLPGEHIERMKSCDPNLQGIEEDRVKILEYYCADFSNMKEVTDCVTETYEGDYEEMQKIAEPFKECLESLFGED